MIAQHTDRLTGILGIAVSSMYVYQASLIEDSLLADAVGVAGVPTAIGYLMLAASMCLFLKSWLKTKQKPEVSEEETEPGGSEHPHWKALSQKRRLPNFGNAGTVQSMLSVAKVNKAARLSEADRAWKEAVSRGERPLPPLPHPDVLLKADFAGQVRTKVPAPVL